MTEPAPKLPLFIDFLPNETLYSWTARYHVLSANASESISREQLFGSSFAGRHFHVPSHLLALSVRSRLHFGNAKAIAADRTTLPYFLRFRQTLAVDETLAAVLGKVTAGVTQKIGLGKAAPQFVLPRRCCPECMRRDKETFGIAYWHRTHQLPGTIMCVEHGCVLSAVPLLPQHAHRNAFVWPGDAETAPTKRARPTKHATEHLLQLAKLSQQMLLATAFMPLDLAVTKAVFMTRLGEMGLTAMGEGVAYDEAQKRYTRHFASISHIPEIAVGLSSLSIRPLDHICRSRRVHLHPYEYMLLIDWLFGSWDEFSERIQVVRVSRGCDR